MNSRSNTPESDRRATTSQQTRSHQTCQSVDDLETVPLKRQRNKDSPFMLLKLYRFNADNLEITQLNRQMNEDRALMQLKLYRFDANDLETTQLNGRTSEDSASMQSNLKLHQFNPDHLKLTHLIMQISENGTSMHLNLHQPSHPKFPCPPRFLPIPEVSLIRCEGICYLPPQASPSTTGSKETRLYTFQSPLRLMSFPSSSALA